MANEFNYLNDDPEVNTLRDDIQKLKNDFNELLTSMSIEGKEKLMNTKKRLQNALNDIKDETGKHFHRMYNTCCEHSHNAAERSREKITERPLTSVLISFAVGMLLGKLVTRRY